MSNVSSYVDYFRQIAVKHSQLQHDPATENGDGEPGKKRFTRWTADEALNGLRTSISFPALLLELYDNETGGESVYEVRQNPYGAFTILEHAQPGSFTSEMEAFVKAETIAYQVLQKIWADHYGPQADRCKTPFKDIALKYNITAVGPLFDNEFGYRCEFAFTLHDTVNLAEPPPFGAFLQ